MEKFTELTEIGTSDPKVRPDEHPQLAVHGLVVEECKWLSIIAEEISLITLFDITACIQAKQFSHEDSNHLAVPLECNGIASFDRAEFPIFEGSIRILPAMEQRFSRWKAEQGCRKSTYAS